MENMRSRGFMVRCQKNEKLVKRGFREWFFVLRFLANNGSDHLLSQFCRRKKRRPEMSSNRISYYVLKTNYSTTALNEFIIQYSLGNMRFEA